MVIMAVTSRPGDPEKTATDLIRVTIDARPHELLELQIHP